jgi:hypothetical protein
MLDNKREFGGQNVKCSKRYKGAWRDHFLRSSQLRLRLSTAIISYYRLNLNHNHRQSSACIISSENDASGFGAKRDDLLLFVAKNCFIVRRGNSEDAVCAALFGVL